MSEILSQNSKLIDEGFLQAATYCAQKLQEEGDKQQANFLLGLVRQLSPDDLAIYRQYAYMQLIQSLVQCYNSSPEQQTQVLVANQSLIDAGLIEKMEQVAAMELDNPEGDSTISDYLLDLAQALNQNLNESQHNQAYSYFLGEILQAIGTGADQEQVYSLFQQNLDKLNLDLAQVIQSRIVAILAKTLEAEQKQAIGYCVGQFGYLIHYFPLQNRQNSLEIAITCYK